MEDIRINKEEACSLAESLNKYTDLEQLNLQGTSNRPSFFRPPESDPWLTALVSPCSLLDSHSDYPSSRLRNKRQRSTGSGRVSEGEQDAHAAESLLYVEKEVCLSRDDVY